MPVEDQLVNKWKASEGRSLLEMATGYKTSKDLPALTEINKEKIHTALLAAGMTPGLGNIADAADALLYAAEGEFGSAGLAAASMVPIAGQLVSAKRALKAAKKSGEKMVKLYRGVVKWHPGSMVKEGKFVGSHMSRYDPTGVSAKKLPKGTAWVSDDIKEARMWGGDVGTVQSEFDPKAVIMEFEIPESIFKKMKKTKALSGRAGKSYNDLVISGKIKSGDLESFIKSTKPGYNYGMHGGIPKEFLKKVHK